MKNKITLVVATKDRLIHVRRLLLSLSLQSYKKFSFIILDQSKNIKNQKHLRSLVEKLKDGKYIFCVKEGKSLALNQSLSLVKTELVAFTDDDCILSKDWLLNLCKAFESTQEIEAVFGQTLPYKPHQNKELFCLSTNLFHKNSVISKVTTHWNNVGFGNNMAFRTSKIKQLGGFEILLGPGTITRAAEDAYLILVTLSQKYKVLRLKDAVVFHNKWQTKKGHLLQVMDYLLGEVACYGSFLFTENKVAKKVLLKNLYFILNYKTFIKFGMFNFVMLIKNYIIGVVFAYLIYRKRENEKKSIVFS